MPTYTYRCADCAAAHELVRPIDRHDDPGPCPGCGGELRQRFGRVGVRLDGWGFSATDGMVPDRPDRGSYREMAERAERISDGG